MITIVKRNRRLENEDDVFTQNAWDDAEWTEEMLVEARERFEQQKLEAKNVGLSIEKVEPEVVKKWDEFYQAHGDKFFKDRRWIFSEFPEILSRLEHSSPNCNLFEVGCGVGNAVAHIIGTNKNAKLHVFCCDLSPSAINTMKKRDFFQTNASKITAFQADVCNDFHDVICKEIEKNSLDFITLIFTMSALKPETMQTTVHQLASLLKPGGMILFRDYAQYDLTQLRFKGKSFLKDNYYVRADGTTSYFFTLQFVDELFTNSGLTKIELKEDNRILVNRLKSLKMCRRWVQAKYAKVLA